jgi:uncharacterized membrane protein
VPDSAPKGILLSSKSFIVIVLYLIYVEMKLYKALKLPAV